MSSYRIIISSLFNDRKLYKPQHKWLGIWWNVNLDSEYSSCYDDSFEEAQESIERHKWKDKVKIVDESGKEISDESITNSIVNFFKRSK